MLRWNAPLAGLEQKGGDDSLLTVQYVSLATAVVSLATGVIGLVKSTGKRAASDS